MALAYFDCFAGAGGDMVVASLVDAGADLDALRSQLARLGLEGYELSTETVTRSGIAGTRFDVQVDLDHQPHRHLHHILEMIDAARLPERAAGRARRVFTRLAEAEAKVHKTTVEKVHFHEVGAVDSIIDVVGACVALEQLGIDRVLCAPIPLGRGTIRCDHGLMPVPAPATAELVRGAATTPGVNEGELTTPTAAALFTTLAEAYGPPPEMTPSTIGWGAGTRDEGPLPNLLRVIIAESAESEADAVVELSANLDDCTGEVLGGAIEALLTAGCLDAWATPAVMKKSRPAWVLSAVCAPGDVAAVESVLFEHTTTFGVRRSLRSRTRLDRRFETVETPFGPIRVKLGIAGQRVVTASPEFEDCAQAARSHHASPREVMQAALQAYHAGSAT